MRCGTHRNSRTRTWLSRILALGVILLLPGLLGGCATSQPDFAIPPTSTDDPLAQAKASLASGNELQASERLTKFLEQNPGSIHVDEANYLLGQAHLGMKDPVLASDYFQKVTRDFPTSSLAGESSYYLAVCYDRLSRPSALDQDWTERAIGAYRLFQVKYPEHARAADALARIVVLEDRLAQKSYETGTLYLKMGRPVSAEVYFRRVLDEFPQSSYACRASIGLGQAFMKRFQWEQAAVQLQQAVDACPEQPSASRARELLEETREVIRRAPAPSPAVAADSTVAPDSTSAP